MPDIPKPEDTLADIPFVKSFVVRHPGSGSQHTIDFYKNYRRHDQNLNTYKKLLVEEPERAETFLKKIGGIGNATPLTGYKDAIGNYASLIRGIYKDPEMSPEDKRQLIDGYYRDMSAMAKQGNALMVEISTTEETEETEETKEIK